MEIGILVVWLIISLVLAGLNSLVLTFLISLFANRRDDDSSWWGWNDSGGKIFKYLWLGLGLMCFSTFLFI